jgi:hypothetical protein
VTLTRHHGGSTAASLIGFVGDPGLVAGAEVRST